MLRIRRRPLRRPKGGGDSSRACVQRHGECAASSGDGGHEARRVSPASLTSSRSMSTPARSRPTAATSTMRRRHARGPDRRPAPRRHAAGDCGSRASSRRTGAATKRSTSRLLRGEDAEATYRLVGIDGDHPRAARPRPATPQGRRRHVRRRHHLRHHRPRGGRRPSGRGERPVHQPARRRRRPCLSRDRDPTAAWRSCSKAPAEIACWAARSPTPRWRTGMRGAPRRPRRLRHVQHGARARPGRRGHVPPHRCRRHHALGARSRRRPRAHGRHIRGERHRLGRDRAAPPRGRPAPQHARYADRPPRARACPRRGRAAGGHRRADRHLQPAPLRPARNGGAASPTPAAAPCCCSTPTTSSRSTTPTATRWATRCWSGLRTGSDPASTLETASRAGAARSLPCCCATSAPTGS